MDTFQKNLNEKLPGKFKIKKLILDEERTDKELFKFLDQRNKFLDGDQNTGITITHVHSPDVADTFGVYSYNVFDLPFYFDSYKDVEKFLTSQFGNLLLGKLNNKHVKNYGFTYSTGERVIPSLFRKVTKLSQLKGMTFRTDLGVINRDFYKTIGIEVLYENFTGKWDDKGLDDILDEGDTTVGELEEYFNEDKKDSSKYLNLTRHSYITSAVLVSKPFVDSLGSSVKSDFEKALSESIKEHRSFVIKENEKVLKQVKKYGYPVYKLKSGEGKLFIKNNKSFYKKHFKLIGNDITDYKKSFLK